VNVETFGCTKDFENCQKLESFETNTVEAFGVNKFFF